MADACLPRSAEFPPRSAGLRPAATSFIQDAVALPGASGPSPQTLGRYHFIPLQRPNQKVHPNRASPRRPRMASAARTCHPPLCRNFKASRHSIRARAPALTSLTSPGSLSSYSLRHRMLLSEYPGHLCLPPRPLRWNPRSRSHWIM